MVPILWHNCSIMVPFLYYICSKLVAI